MPQFRPSLAAGDARPLTDAVVRTLCAETTHRANFFAAAPLELSWDEHPDEETYWELFHGRPLDGSQTRARRRFAAWNVSTVSPDGRRPAEPVIGLKYDAAAGEVHVTRAILCHAHETYDAGGNVIQTREVQKWQRELVGTIRLADLANAGALRDELACRLFQAVVGVSRLPLTSIEAPLPDFTLGQLGYFHRPDTVSAGGELLTSAAELCRLPAEVNLAPTERVKHLELVLRATPAADLNRIVMQHSEVMRGRGLDAAATLTLLREVFNGVTLSPYTAFATKALAFVRHLEAQGEIHITDRVDFLAHLVRQLSRHLAAYDLVTFHHRGANYPDALLLGELLGELLPLAEQVPDLFADAAGDPTARLRRRAVRLGAPAAGRVHWAPGPRRADLAWRKSPRAARAVRAGARGTDPFTDRPPAPAFRGWPPPDRPSNPRRMR